MNKFRRTRRLHCSVTLFCLAIFVAPITANDSDKQRVFLIGNSLTWDTVPTKLDGDVKYHVDCGKSLPFMVANPEMPCIKTSSLWPQTLRDETFDVVCLQVHYGATFAEDIAAISQLIEHQPKAAIVIHSGWARSAERAAEWDGPAEIADSTKMVHHTAYYKRLLETLRKEYPQREFRRTYAADALQIIQNDIDSGQTPIEHLTDLYRDKIHMHIVTGRYLMHNAMRLAVRQKRSQVGFEKLTPELKTYLDSVLDRLPAQN